LLAGARETIQRRGVSGSIVVTEREREKKRERESQKAREAECWKRKTRRERGTGKEIRPMRDGYVRAITAVL
jgi:hypothetical protein